MRIQKPAAVAAPHHCPVCHHPQTRIQRKLGSENQGPISYVCARADDCVLGINLRKVETWVTV